MIKALAILMAGLFATGAANAAPTTEEVEIRDHDILLEVVSQLGINVQMHPAICNQTGWYGAYKSDGSSFALCYKGNSAERLDTIRHEAWHVYQDLKDCSIKDTSGVTAALGAEATPTQYRVFAAKHYQPNQVGYEAEAFWTADTFSAMTIANMIHQKGVECGYKFKF